MARLAGSVVSGLLVWLAIALAGVLVARVGWPAYVAVERQRAFSIDMLGARLAVGMVATVAAGATAALLARLAHQSALLTGAILLAVSVVDHIRIWAEYPVWYHLIYLAYLVPLAALGGRLIERNRAK